MKKLVTVGLSLFFCGCLALHDASGHPVGEISGNAWSHTPESLQQAVATASVALPSTVTGGPVFVGKLNEVAPKNTVKVPVVIFLHGSSGLGLPAIREWQRWLASQGVASVAPDSFSLRDRVTYKSPVDKTAYERIHALRLSEIVPTVHAVMGTSWADADRLVLAGASEGAVAVARYAGREFAGRIIYSWSCEENYFVDAPRNAFGSEEPVLNIISAVDPYFSRANDWLGNPVATGHCGKALQHNRRASIVLIPDAPHTLINMPAARDATLGFLRRALNL